MSEARAFAHRVPLLPLLLFALVEVGCAPAPHAVRLRAADGQVRVTTPAPRPPMMLPKEEIHRVVHALAKKVVPVADPLEFVREQFELPVREGVYILNARTRELRPADRTTEAAEVPSAELLEQARKYLQWCTNRHHPGDCLGVLHGRRTLDAYGRYTVAMGIAIAGTLETTKDGLEDMVSIKEVLAMVVAGVTMYAVLWTFPELTTKGIATAITIVLVGYVGVHTLYTLGGGFVDLIENSEKATTFDALHDAGEHFAQVMGTDAARILVMVATAAVGTGLSHGLTQLAKVLPSLPGVTQASELAVEEGAVAFNQVEAVESVTIGKSGLTISLVNGAVLATSLSGNLAPGPRINLYRPTTQPAAKLDRILSLLRPAGRLIGEPGTSPKIRILRGGEQEARALFEQLTLGGRTVPSSTYPGTLVELEDVGTVGFRLASKSGPPTIDVFIEGLGIREIKFVL